MFVRSQAKLILELNLLITQNGFSAVKNVGLQFQKKITILMEELENHNSIQRRKGIDKHPKIKRNKSTYYMANFSSKEIESQYNLFKKLLSDRINYKEVLEAIKKLFVSI